MCGKGDATTAEKRSWRVLAWPTDATTGTEPVLDSSVINENGGSFGIGSQPVQWGAQGVLWDQHYLDFARKKWTSFVEPGNIELQKNAWDGGTDRVAGGTAAGLSFFWVSENQTNVARKGSDNYTGWVAFDSQAKERWRKIDQQPTKDPFGTQGAGRQGVLWGDYAIAIALDEQREAGSASYFKADTGEKAQPSPQDFAGRPIFGKNQAGDDSVLGSRDGAYVAFSVYDQPHERNGNFVLDVASGKVTRVPSERELTAGCFVGGTLLLNNDQGGVSFDIATGKATVLETGKAPVYCDGDYGIFFSGEGMVIAKKG